MSPSALSWADLCAVGWATVVFVLVSPFLAPRPALPTSQCPWVPVTESLSYSPVLIEGGHETRQCQLLGADCSIPKQEASVHSGGCEEMPKVGLINNHNHIDTVLSASSTRGPLVVRKPLLNALIPFMRASPQTPSLPKPSSELQFQQRMVGSGGPNTRRSQRHFSEMQSPEQG